MKKIIVISGGTSGIGKALSKMFANQGNIVVPFGLNANQIAGEFEVDVTKESQVDVLFSTIKEKHGKIDLLINCAGYGVSGAAELSNFNQIKNLFDVNYFGALKCIKSALPMMEKGGKIVNISSCCALFPMPFRIHYCASKSALSMLSYGLKMELDEAGIDVATINPGDVRTNFTSNRVKNFETSEKYGNRVENAQALVEKNNKKRMSEEYATKKIFKICNKKKFKAMYIIGRKYKFFNFLIKLFPINTFLKVSNKLFGGKKKV